MTAKKTLPRPKKKSRPVVTTSVGLLAKSLVSNDLKTREYSQRDAKMILTDVEFSKEGNLTYTDVLGICKGLHYSLWMQDKFIRKEEVVARFCDILTGITRETICSYYFQAVLETLAREWDKLDKWQEDKFMLLSRDFFTRGLHHFSAHDPNLWHQFLDAVFDKILNVDVHHAIALKMHMCTVLYEELAKKKIKAFCIVNTLSKCIDLLPNLPRHNSYSHSILRLIQQLHKIIRRHSRVDLTQLLHQVNAISNLKTSHRASISRIVNGLRLLERKQASRVSSSVLRCATPSMEIPCDSQTVLDIVTSKGDADVSEQLYIPDLSTNATPTEITSKTDLCSLKKRLKKRTRKFDKKKTKPIVRQFNELPDCPMDLLSSGELMDPPCSTTSPLKAAAITSLPNMEAAMSENPMEGTTPKRRVSFGKVYRKKFIASRRLPLTPTVLTTPSKGILREQGASRQNRRISL